MCADIQTIQSLASYTAKLPLLQPSDAKYTLYTIRYGLGVDASGKSIVEKKSNPLNRRLKCRIIKFHHKWGKWEKLLKTIPFYQLRYRYKNILKYRI